MVSYQLAPEQQDLRDSVAQFAREVVAPIIAGYYERGEFPYDIVARMGKLGRDHAGSRRLARRDADLPVRHRGTAPQLAA